MKIAITATGPELNASVDPRFGRCAYFIIVDPQTMEYRSIENPNISLGGGAGIQTAQLIAQQEVHSVLTGNCGPNAFQTLSAAGIQVLTGVSGSIRQAVDQFKMGAHTNAAGPNVVDHFGMGGGGRGMGGGMGMGGGGRGMGGGMGMGGGGRGMGRGMGMGGGGRGMGRGMGMGGTGRGMSGAIGVGKSGSSFPAEPEQARNDEESIEQLKNQIKAMEEQLATLKERIREKGEGGGRAHLVARVISDRCTGCKACQDVCPTGAISIVRSVARVESLRCTGCGQCVQACPRQAIVLKTS
jgi:predicted Fe-Mo cluster-binding NifX family protein/ferredoxin